MDTIDSYRRTIREKLTYYEKIPYAYGDIKCKAVFDSEKDCYVLLTFGWDDDQRIYGCLIHIEIIDRKVWIQRDGTEYGIANELMEAGIPKDRIVLAFHPPEIRPYTGFAAA